MSVEIIDNGLLLKKSEIAKMFRVTERTIETWVRAGIIPALRLGRSVYFDREAIMKHVREKQQLT